MFELVSESSESPVVVAIPGSSGQIPGTLCYDPENGVTLAIIDVTADLRQVLLMAQASYTTICGQLQNGRLFTLIDCMVQSTGSGASGFVNRTIRADSMLSGIHLADTTASIFDEISVHLSSLTEWMEVAAITQSLEQLQPPQTGRRVTLSCQHSPPFGFSPLDGGTSLVSDQNIHVEFGRASRAEVRSEFSLRLCPKAPFGLDSLTGELFRLLGLFSLLCGHQVFIEGVSLLRAGTSGRERSMSSARYLARFARPPQGFDKRRSTVLLPRPVLGNSLPEIWANWSNRYEQYRSPIELYMATEMFHGQLSNFEFLAIMQALETLHRNVAGGEYLPEDQYGDVADALIGAIPQNTPHDLRDALKTRLRYGNEFSLRRRVKELWTILPDGVRAVLHPDSFSIFLGRVIDTRNYLTHHDPALQAEAYQDSELYFATRLLRWICLAVILRDIGVSDSTLTDALKRSDELAHVRKAVMSSSKRV